MNVQRLHKIVKVVFSMFMITSAIGEVSLNETVIYSMNIIDMPVYLLYLLGVLKSLGVLAIWVSPYSWIKEWAYAGFVFDFVGAMYSFLYLGEYPIPDVIMAPLALLLCLTTYLSWKR